MYKHSTSQLPKAFENYFVTHGNQNGYHTRNTKDYIICKTKTNFAQKTIRTAGPKIWNKINKTIKMSKSLKSFRLQIKANILSNYI